MKNLNTFKLLSDYESEKSGGVLNTPNVSFVAEDNSIRYLLENTIPGNFENGYEWVDLGLPSGIKWATCNVGASNPQDYGMYFAWGKTTGYTYEQLTGGERMFSSSVYSSGSPASISTDLSGSNDAATVNLGGNWRMPTKEEFQELINYRYTTTTWTKDYNGTGVAGGIITSKSNSNSIFLPATGYYDGSSMDGEGNCGYYWTSSGSSSGAYEANLDYRGIIVGMDTDMNCNYSIRGVCE